MYNDIVPIGLARRVLTQVQPIVALRAVISLQQNNVFIFERGGAGY
jgi:hypothetical protein